MMATPSIQPEPLSPSCGKNMPRISETTAAAIRIRYVKRQKRDLADFRRERRETDSTMV
jgi:hypothetical protein